MIFIAHSSQTRSCRLVTQKAAAPKVSIFRGVFLFFGSRSVGSSATVGTHKNVQMGTAPFYSHRKPIVLYLYLPYWYVRVIWLGTSNPAILDSYYVLLYISSEGNFERKRMWSRRGCLSSKLRRSLGDDCMYGRQGVNEKSGYIVRT
jgi:hypothetical protein